MPELKDLPKDIYALFDPDKDHQCNEENLNAFAENIKELMRVRLKAYTPPSNPLRFSALGRPDRQVWYDAHPEEGTKERLRNSTFLKFLYGDIIEQLVLFLTKEAGHSVTHEQATVEVDGVLGHTDAIVDDVVVDVKSASPYSYRKFEDGRVTEDDPFGYVAQLSGYSSELAPDQDAAWIAMDKVSGEICTTPLRSVVINHHKPAERIKHLKKVIENEEPPQRCYPTLPDGKSGNMRLGTPCSYCSWKFRCHPGLRVFAYANGPRFLSEVKKLPDVPEITENFDLV